MLVLHISFLQNLNSWFPTAATALYCLPTTSHSSVTCLAAEGSPRPTSSLPVVSGDLSAELGKADSYHGRMEDGEWVGGRMQRWVDRKDRGQREGGRRNSSSLGRAVGNVSGIHRCPPLLGNCTPAHATSPHTCWTHPQVGTQEGDEVHGTCGGASAHLASLSWDEMPRAVLHEQLLGS